MDDNTWAKVLAALNRAAGEEVERRGYSQFRFDNETVETFKNTIHIRRITEGIENARHQRPTHSVVYSNRSRSDYVIPETWEIDSRRDTRLRVDYSADIDGEIQWPRATVVNVEARQVLRARVEDEAHERRQHVLGPITAPRQCMVRLNSVRRTETRQYVLGTEGNIRIVVNPGHPIAKHAAIGGAAGAAAGGAAGVGAGSVIGGAVGVIAGPPGVALGIFLGGFIGGLVGTSSGATAIGGVGGAIGAARGVAERHNIQFTITAKNVFRKLPNFRQEGYSVFCQVTVSHQWDEEQREITEETD